MRSAVQFWWETFGGLLCRVLPWECPEDREYREFMERYPNRGQ